MKTIPVSGVCLSKGIRFSPSDPDEQETELTGYSYSIPKIQKPNVITTSGFTGEPGGDRTHDPLIKSQVLYL